MKLLLKYSLVAFFAIVLFSSCDNLNCIKGEGLLVSDTLSISDFSKIDLAGEFDIVISQGLTQEIIAIGHSNIIEKLVSSHDEDLWIVELEDECYDDFELTIYVAIPAIEEINISGSGEVIINNFNGQDNLNLDISGSGNIVLNSFNSMENLSVNISGSGNIIGNEESLNFKKLNIEISGSGNYEGYLINTNECLIDIPGSGNCKVFVNELLDINISGSGSVYYKGDPAVTQHISGSGSVINDN